MRELSSSSVCSGLRMLSADPIWLRMWATISLEHKDVVRYESTKMDYIRRSNIKEISGREGS
ncbi:hypothetical protein YC2023_016223 [Brassica napus]